MVDEREWLASESLELFPVKDATSVAGALSGVPNGLCQI
jgi:hypothetical protein